MFNVFGREFNSRHLHHEQHIRPPAPQPVGFFVSQPAHSVRIRHIRHLDSSDDVTTMSTTTTGLVGRTGMSRDEAEAFIKSYFANFPGIAEWQQRTLAFTREKGYAETVFGRRRYLPAIHSSNFQVRSAAEREAINMPIQGTAADIIKVAMIDVDAELRERQLRGRMILQVHDELIFECPAEEVDAIRDLAVRRMRSALEMNVPLKVDLKQGRNWGEME